jgi:hypothetical protein
MLSTPDSPNVLLWLDPLQCRWIGIGYAAPDIPNPAAAGFAAALFARLALAGITAPGLRALAAALHQDGFCTFAVSAPAGERSAQSHCITVGKHLHAWQLDVEGAEEAFAVDGTPGGVRKGMRRP